MNACKLYQGPPVSLDVAECPSYCLPLAQQLAYYREAAVEVYKQVRLHSTLHRIRCFLLLCTLWRTWKLMEEAQSAPG